MNTLDLIHEGEDFDPERTRYHGDREPVDLTDPGPTTLSRAEYERIRDESEAA